MFNLYIDESCHLEHDNMPVMCIGYTKVPSKLYPQIKEEFKSLSSQFKSPTEVKWNTLSKSRLDFYKALVDWFFNSEICFRCILVKYKSRLNHDEFNQGSHDNYYYKLIYLLLASPTNSPLMQYKIYLDIKDTRGKQKLEKINEVLTGKYKGNSPFIHFQHIHSNESILLQLTDLFIGAVTFKSRGLHKLENASRAKIDFLNYLEQKSGYALDAGTKPWETKFNIFDHQPKSSLNGLR